MTRKDDMSNSLSSFSRRRLLKTTAGLAVGLPMVGCALVKPPKKLFDISLAQWSLHRMLRKGELDHLDFPGFAQKEFGIFAVEYVNTFFFEKAKDEKYLNELKRRCADHGVTSVLIMCDREGQLGDPSERKRTKAVENHYQWVEAAKLLGCHSIRVNAQSRGSYEEQKKLAIDGLSRLSDFGRQHEINVIVENHGGLSSNGQWLSSVIRGVGQTHCGTLPDFGNFKEYDRYQGVEDLMPFAKGVSAKSHDFSEQGEEINTDFKRMLSIVQKHGYRGYIGVEYEGKKRSEIDGIKLTKALMEKYRG